MQFKQPETLGSATAGRQSNSTRSPLTPRRSSASGRIELGKEPVSPKARLCNGLTRTLQEGESKNLEEQVDRRSAGPLLRLNQYDKLEYHYYKAGPASRIQNTVRQLLKNGTLNHGDNILEIGFHTGRNLLWLVDSCPNINIYGIDLQQNLVDEVSNAIYEAGQSNHAEVKCCDLVLDRFPWHHKRFQLIFAADGVLSHLSKIDLTVALRRLTKLVGPSGIILLSVDDPAEEEAQRICEGVPYHIRTLRGLWIHSYSELAKIPPKGFVITNVERYKEGEKRVGAYSNDATFWYTIQLKLTERWFTRKDSYMSSRSRSSSCPARNVNVVGHHTGDNDVRAGQLAD